MLTIFKSVTVVDYAQQIFLVCWFIYMQHIICLYMADEMLISTCVQIDSSFQQVPFAWCTTVLKHTFCFY